MIPGLHGLLPCPPWAHCPQDVVDALADEHPDVSLMFHAGLGRWVAVRVGEVSGKPELLIVIQDDGCYTHPNYFNTVNALSEIDTARYGYWARKRWFERLKNEKDDSKDVRTMARGWAEDQVDRLWHKEGRRVALPMNGAKR